MKVLHVNNTDLVGSRFNGFSMLEKQDALGIKAKQIVLHKMSDSPYVSTLGLPLDSHSKISQYEKLISVRCLCYPYVDVLMQSKDFKEADLVHYHLLHNEMFSLFDLPRLFSAKKSVWTIHDPWLLTGHCVHPLECKKYLEGCGNCPDLERNFSIVEDTSHIIWKIKEKIFSETSIPLIVASDWMKKMIEGSKFGKFFPSITKIPFGIELNVFKPVSDSVKKNLKKKYGLSNGFTIFFREDPSPFKGMEIIIEALLRLNIPGRINVVTVGAKNLLPREIYKKYNVKEFGWVEKKEDIVPLYQLSDVFLMPSKAESFGVMGIESLACGTPLITRKGTAVDEITNGGAISLVFSTLQELIDNIMQLYSNESERIRIS